MTRRRGMSTMFQWLPRRDRQEHAIETELFTRELRDNEVSVVDRIE